MTFHITTTINGKDKARSYASDLLTLEQLVKHHRTLVIDEAPAVFTPGNRYEAITSVYDTETKKRLSQYVTTLTNNGGEA